MNVHPPCPVVNTPLPENAEYQPAEETIDELISRHQQDFATGSAGSPHSTGMIHGHGTMRIGEAATKLDAASLAIADTIVDAIITLELDHSRDMVARHGTMRYFVYPNGRAGSTFTHEFFPFDAPTDDAIQFAQSLAGPSPHLISPMGQRIDAETGIYEAAGYEHVAEWTLMVRPLTERVSQLGDERAVLIEDAATEDRVVSTILAIGGSEHPTRSGHVADPAIRQRWISDGGEPASFGRMVLLGNHAYLGDMATVPAYRRRGHAAAIMRSLLDDALAFGATACVLASTAMAHGLYLSFGFRDVMPMVEFQTRKG